jgi:predicted RNA-binding Zn-ribbon protein involved in translation (DUF1610 family)
MRKARCPDCGSDEMTLLEIRQVIYEFLGATKRDNTYCTEIGEEIDEGPYSPAEFMCSNCGGQWTDLAHVLGDEDDDSDSESGTSSYRAID